jgi:hypothetical protein
MLAAAEARLPESPGIYSTCLFAEVITAGHAGR